MAVACRNRESVPVHGSFILRLFLYHHKRIQIYGTFTSSVFTVTIRLFPDGSSMLDLICIYYIGAAFNFYLHVRVRGTASAPPHKHTTTHIMHILVTRVSFSLHCRLLHLL